VTRLDLRLARLEQRRQFATQHELRVFWDAELVPCTTHQRCDVERGTGIHHRDVIRLFFEDLPT
jgi:hypothetical protein